MAILPRQIPIGATHETISANLKKLVFAFLEKNDEIIMNDSLYSPTRSYCEKILKKLGIKIKYFHPTKKWTWKNSGVSSYCYKYIKKTIFKRNLNFRGL